MIWIGMIIGVLLGWFMASSDYAVKLNVIHKVPRAITDEDRCTENARLIAWFLRTRRKITKAGNTPSDMLRLWEESYGEKLTREDVKDARESLTGTQHLPGNMGHWYLANLCRLVDMTGCRIIIQEKEHNDWTGGLEEPIVTLPPTQQGKPKGKKKAEEESAEGD